RRLLILPLVLMLSSCSCCRRRSRKVGGVAGNEERERPSAGVRGIGLTRRGKSNYLPAPPPSQANRGYGRGITRGRLGQPNRRLMRVCRSKLLHSSARRSAGRFVLGSMFLVRRYRLEPDTVPLRIANCKLGTIMDLALFPLQTVLFPSMKLPLH